MQTDCKELEQYGAQPNFLSFKVYQVSLISFIKDFKLNGQFENDQNQFTYFTLEPYLATEINFIDIFAKIYYSLEFVF